MPTYAKYLRYRHFDRTRHSKMLLAYLATEAQRLTGTGTGQPVTFDNTTNQVSLVAHGFETGDGPIVFANDGGALPAELDQETLYWVGSASVDAINLYPTEADAIEDTNVVTFTGDGTGTSTLLMAADEATIFQALKNGKSALEISGLQSIDDL